MPSETSIKNRASAVLGGALIADPAARNAPVERWFNALYEPVFEEVLSLWPWSCARGRHKLTRDSTPPDFGFSYQFTLPGQVIAPQAVQVSGSWEFEQRKILCDSEGPLNVLTTDRIPPEHLHPLVASAMGGRLAFATAMAVSQSTTLGERIKPAVQDLLLEAMMVENSIGSALPNATSGWSFAVQTDYRPEERVAALGWGEHLPYEVREIEVPS